jgi:hypothetical protein
MITTAMMFACTSLLLAPIICRPSQIEGKRENNVVTSFIRNTIQIPSQCESEEKEEADLYSRFSLLLTVISSRPDH